MEHTGVGNCPKIIHFPLYRYLHNPPHLPCLTLPQSKSPRRMYDTFKNYLHVTEPLQLRIIVPPSTAV